MIPGYPFSEKKLWVKNELVRVGFSICVAAKKCGIFEAVRLFALEKAQLLYKLKNPSVNQVQSVAGSRNESRKCVHGYALFWQVFTLSSKIETNSENWQK